VPLTKTRTTARYQPNLDGVPESDIETVLDEVGEYIISSILDDVGGGLSPVTGQRFKFLNKDYADEDKGGDRLPNLDLEGDMLNSLVFIKDGDAVEYGIFNEAQAIKSYGHNTGMEGHPFLDGKVPERKFIPSDNENLRRSILDGIDRIVDNYRLPPELELEGEDIPLSPNGSNGGVAVSTQASIFDSLFEDLFGG
jgi:hypothetical protein